MDIRIINIRENPELVAEAIQYFWGHWGAASNHNFYRDCILQSCTTESELPRFYLAIEDGKIIGSYALLRSDLNSRQDLSPWFACLYVNKEARGRKIGDLLQTHAIKEAKEKGFSRLYLCTDFSEYYERTNWSYVGNGYSISDDQTRIYEYKIDDKS